MNIKEIVLTYFGLDEASKERFSEAYDNPFIDDIYKLDLGDDHRLRIPLEGALYEKFDRGWGSFKSMFPELITKYDISYNEFYNNKKIQGKDSFRIIKLIRSYFKTDLTEEKIELLLDRMNCFENLKFNEYREFCYVNNVRTRDKKSIEKAVNLMIDRINELRFSKTKNIEVVLSFNRNDWFLSTTNENWRTCLSLESPSFASYWVSLAGAVVDKNIALLYITNGEKKDYFGNVVDKVLSRSWVLLDENNDVNAVKFYPNAILNLEDISKLFPFELKYLSGGFKSKHRITPLLFENGYTNYLYQDKTEPVNYKDGSFSLVSGSNGLYTFYKEKRFEGPVFNYTDGLSNLIEIGARKKTPINMMRFFNCPVTCSHCKCLISSARSYKVDCRNEDRYCLECYEKGIMPNYNYNDDDYDNDDNDDDYDNDNNDDDYDNDDIRWSAPLPSFSLSFSNHTGDLNNQLRIKKFVCLDTTGNEQIKSLEDILLVEGE